MESYLSHQEHPHLESYSSQFSEGYPEEYRVGGAVIDAEGKAHVYNSDRPAAHRREARQMYRVVQRYLTSPEGKDFLNYLISQGAKLMDIAGVGAEDLPEGTVAAVKRNDLEGILVGNYAHGKSFEYRVGEMARQYSKYGGGGINGVGGDGVNRAAMMEYVLAHEIAHAAGYSGEAEVEQVLQDYFTAKAGESRGAQQEKYQALAKVAGQRKKTHEN